MAESYKHFSGHYPKRKVLLIQDQAEKEWLYYRSDPSTQQNEPLVFLPPAGGSADCYYKQMISLAPLGFYLIMTSPPPYYSIGEFLEGLLLFFQNLKIHACHLFGAGLGGYLALCFAQHYPARTLSLVKCNSFGNTGHFLKFLPNLFTMNLSPKFLLRQCLLEMYDKRKLPRQLVEAIDFMVEECDRLPRAVLLGHLHLLSQLTALKPRTHITCETTLIKSLDQQLVPDGPHAFLMRFIAGAHEALLKEGGDFPFLAAADEVNMHIQVHLRRWYSSV